MKVKPQTQAKTRQTYQKVTRFKKDCVKYRVFLKKFLDKREEKIQEKIKVT